MKINKFCLVVLALCALTSSFVGCGAKGSGSRSGLVAAAGVVKYNGAPVDDAVIEFRSAEGVENSLAAGRSDAEGKFTLMTDRPNDGALPGKYKVTVKKQVETIDGLTREEYMAQHPSEGDEKSDVVFSKERVVVEQLLPVQYSDPENTPLEIEIPAKGNKKIALDLQD